MARENGMKVLVAGDDELSRRMLDALLTEAGYQVVLAQGGQEALAVAVGQDPPRILLLDWGMPGLDGIEVCRRVRRRGGAARPYILLISEKPRRQDALDGLDAGADDFITKPYAPEELLARVRVAERVIGATTASSGLVLQALSEALESPGGEVMVRSGEAVGRIFVHEGRVAWAHVSTEPISLYELLEPDEWATVKARGLTCAVGYAPAGDPATRLTVGWNRRDNHAWLVPGYERGIALAAAAGVPNVICFSGNRGGLSDEEGLAACADGLKRLMPAAERSRVTVIMELLNSKVDHKDYQCDRTPWGVELVRRVGSERFKLLYDIYHMQIMEGDVIRTVRDHGRHIAHYHVAGNPGRHEPDASQELNYPAVMRAIAETGFAGYVAQEFLPTREPLAALAEAVRICRV